MSDISEQIYEQLRAQTDLLGQILETLQREVVEEETEIEKSSYDRDAVYNPATAREFAKECLVTASGAELGGDEVLRVWENWCRGRGIRLGQFNKGNQNYLYKSLESVGIRSKRPTAPDGSRFRVYLDVALNGKGRGLR